MIVNFKNYRTSGSNICTTSSAAPVLETEPSEEELVAEYNRGYAAGYTAGYEDALRANLKSKTAEPEYTTGEYEYIESDEFGTYTLSDEYYEEEAAVYEPSTRTKLIQCGIYVAMGIMFVLAMKAFYMI